jgi:hypothetical protein
MKLNEGLDYHDMKGQVNPKVTVDEYAAKMGKDSDIVTLTLKTNSKLAAEDLEAWLEIGYDYVLDASTSDGEIEPGKWLLFIEMKRRGNVPEKIIQILEDLETLTDIKLKDYTITIKDEDYDADIDVLKQVMILSPEEYKKIEDRKEKEEEAEQEAEKELNEMRHVAGLDRKKVYKNVDEEIKHLLDIARI